MFSLFFSNPKFLFLSYIIPLFIIRYTSLSNRWQIISIPTLQKRQILVTLVEILLPLLFSGILIVLRQKVPFKDFPNATVYESYDVDTLPKKIPHLQLAYVPGNSSVVRQVAEDVRGSLSLPSGMQSLAASSVQQYWLVKARHIMLIKTSIWHWPINN